MVFIFFRSRPSDSPILLPPSKKGAIVTESIIKCVFSDWIFDEECDGDIRIFVHQVFFVLFELFVYQCHPFMFRFLSMTIPIYAVL